MYSICKKSCKIFVSPPLHSLSESQKVSKIHPIFSKSLKTVTTISAEAKTPHQEQLMYNITWEVKFQMFLEFEAMRIVHVDRHNYHLMPQEGKISAHFHSHPFLLPSDEMHRNMKPLSMNVKRL
jgi:hypothetical protein